MANELVSTIDVRIVTGSRKNLDKEFFEDHIERLQLRELKPFLGEDLYDELITQNNADNLSALNATLLNTYIKPFLCYAVLWERIPFIHFDLGNNGLQVNTTDETEPAQLNELSKFQSDVQTLKNAHQKYMYDYLEDNASDYPLYVVDDDNVSNNLLGGYGPIIY